MDITQPLLPFAAQMMFLGRPLVKGTDLGRPYDALLNMLADQDALRQFIHYLQEAGT